MCPLEPADMEAILRHPRALGVAEMMNFPGVIAGTPDVLARLELSGHVDGHAPGVMGRELDAYVAAGIRSDHEATTFDEALEKRRRGMWVLLREASNARNLRDLLPLVGQYGPEHCAFCTDDREPDFLFRDGHIDQMCRVAVEDGIAPEAALLMATLHPARCHGLMDRGAVAPGLRADLVLLDDLETFRPARVYKDGVLVAAGRARRAVRAAGDPRACPQHDALRPAAGRRVRDRRRRARARDRDDPGPAHHARARGGALAARRRGGRGPDARPGQDRRDRAPPRDRPRRARAWCAGFGLRSGAFASTVAHDAHNLVVVGVVRRGHGRLRGATAGDRRRDRGRARRRGARRAGAAGRRAALRRAGRGRGRRARGRCRTCCASRA